MRHRVCELHPTRCTPFGIGDHEASTFNAGIRSDSVQPSAVAHY